MPRGPIRSPRHVCIVLRSERSETCLLDIQGEGGYLVPGGQVCGRLDDQRIVAALVSYSDVSAAGLDEVLLVNGPTRPDGRGISNFLDKLCICPSCATVYGCPEVLAVVPASDHTAELDLSVLGIVRARCPLR